MRTVQARAQFRTELLAHILPSKFTISETIKLDLSVNTSIGWESIKPSNKSRNDGLTAFVGITEIFKLGYEQICFNSPIAFILFSSGLWGQIDPRIASVLGNLSPQQKQMIASVLVCWNNVQHQEN